MGTDVHSSPAELRAELPPAHLRSVALFGKWFGMLLAAAGLGACMALLWVTGLSAPCAWAAFAFVYGLSVWKANASRLEELGA